MRPESQRARPHVHGPSTGLSLSPHRCPLPRLCSTDGEGARLCAPSCWAAITIREVLGMLINSYIMSNFGEQNRITTGAVERCQRVIAGTLSQNRTPAFPCVWPPPACSTPPGLRTPVLKQLSPVDFVLHHVSPVQRALVEVEVQGDGVAQPRDQDAVVTPVQVNAADLMAVGEYDEWLEGVWGKQGRVRRGTWTRQGEGVPGSQPQPHLWDHPQPCTVKGCLCQVGTVRGSLSAGRSPQDPAVPISTVLSSTAAASKSRGRTTPITGSWGDAASPCSPPAHTQAAAALAIRLQHPALVAGALDVVLVLLALLAALEVLGTVALDLAGLVV